MSLVNGIVYVKNLDNTLIKETIYVEGKKQGLESSWYDNGQLKSKIIGKMEKKMDYLKDGLKIIKYKRREII